MSASCSFSYWVPSSSSSALRREAMHLDREVFSGRFGFDTNRSGASGVEVTLKMDIFSICWARSGSSMSSRLLMKSSRSLLEIDEEAFGFLELARWLLKPPKPLATQIQELKMKVVPSSSTALVKLKDATEFSGGCSMNTPTWRASCRYFTATPAEGYPRGGEFVGSVSPRSGTRRSKGTQGIRQVRAGKGVIPYVLCGLDCL
jgi:hypothetical protein